MTRRDFICTAAVAAALPSSAGQLVVPIHRITDSHTKPTPEQLRRFSSDLWPEAVRDYARGGIQLQVSDGPGEIRISPGDRPIPIGLVPGAINMVLTDHIPMYWDSARALPGVTTLYHGYHLCLIALRYAHGNQIPFLSVNTCVHELLHALLQDVFLTRPKWYQAGGREFRIDWYATRLWLFHDGAAIRESTRIYLDRLRSNSAG
jgi:hypothetical protein